MIGFLGIWLYAQPEILPKISEINSFCRETTQQLQEDQPVTTSTIKPSTPNKAFMQQINRLIQQEQRDAYEIVLKKRSQKKWAREDRLQAEYIMQAGLFREAIEYLKSVQNRSDFWIAAGTANWYLASLYQRLGNSAEAKLHQQKALARFKEYTTRKGHKPAYFKQESERNERNFMQNKDYWMKSHQDYLQYTNQLASNPQDWETCKKLVELCISIEYRIESIVYANYALEAFASTISLAEQNSLLWCLARQYTQTCQGRKALQILERMEKANFVGASEPEVIYCKAKAYLELQRYPESKKLLQLLHQYPEFIKTNQWKIDRLEEDLSKTYEN